MWKLLFIILAVYVAISSQNPCASNNGGCDDICLWSGTGNRSCACNCSRTLASDGRRCIDSLCDLDIYFGIDIGATFDLRGCILSGDKPIFTVYIAEIINFLRTFASEDSMRYRFAVQTYSPSSAAGFITILPFSGNISVAVNHNYAINCRASSSNYLATLGNLLPTNPGTMMYFPPMDLGAFRSKTSTTRVGVIFTSGQFSSMSSTDVIVSNLRNFYDDIIIVTYFNQTSNIDRLVSCGSSSLPCNKNFLFRNQLNSFGLNFSRPNFDSVINSSACLSRRGPVPPPVMRCGIVPTLTIMKCSLKGLLLSQLQFQDSSCNLQDFATDLGDAYEIIINPAKCGATVANNNFTQTITVRSVNPLQDFPNVSFTLSCPLFTDQNPCSMNNGNCSEFCVWLPGQPHVCSCQCGKRLRAPGYQCEDINICNIDMLVAVDVGNGLDQRGCFFNNFTASSSLATYKTRTASFLQTFISDSTTARWNIAFQNYSSGVSSTLVTYQDNDFASAVNFISTLQKPNCGGLLSYLSPLEDSVTSNIPGVRRSKINTTRIAVIFTSGAFSSVSRSLESFLQQPRTAYDDIVVISLTTQNEPTRRFTACGNRTKPCNKIFFLNQINAFNKSLSRANFDSVVDYNACFRRQNITVDQVTTQCMPTMSIRIPICLLQGLSLENFQFNNPQCKVADFAQISGSSYVITVSPLLCGIITTVQNENYVLTQRIFTRNMANPSIPSLSFSINCTFSIPPRRPPNPFVFQVDGISDSSFDKIAFYASLNATLIPRLPPMSIVIVNTPVYFEISTNLKSPFFPKLYSCHASPSSNPYHPLMYQLLANQCPVDPTFTILPAASHVVRFSFRMFEFTGVNLGKAIYIHCRIAPCFPASASTACQPASCSTSRKRRDLQSENFLEHSFGPLIVRQSPGLHKNEPFEENVKKIYLFQDFPFSFQYINFAYYCVLLLLVSSLMVCLLKKLFSDFPSENSVKCDEKIPLEKIGRL